MKKSEAVLRAIMTELKRQQIDDRDALRQISFTVKLDHHGIPRAIEYASQEHRELGTL